MNISDRNLLLRELKEQFGLQEHQLQIAGISLNIPSAFAAILQDADNVPEKRLNQEQIKNYLLSEVGVLYCLHHEDWGSFIDYFDGNLSALKQAAIKISEKYDGNISAFLEYELRYG